MNMSGETDPCSNDIARDLDTAIDDDLATQKDTAAGKMHVTTAF